MHKNHHPGDIGLRREMGGSISVALTLVHGNLEQRAEDLEADSGPVGGCTPCGSPSIPPAFISIGVMLSKRPPLKYGVPTKSPAFRSARRVHLSEERSRAGRTLRGLRLRLIDHASEELLGQQPNVFREHRHNRLEDEVLGRPAEGCRDPSSSGRPRTPGRLLSG